MTNLTEILAGDNREEVARELAGAIDTMVGNFSGIMGFAVSQAYGAIKKSDPTGVERAMNRALPQLAPAIQPYWDDYTANAQGTGFGNYLSSRKDEVTEQVFGMVDGALDSVNNEAALKFYQGMRDKLMKLTRENLTPLGDAVERIVTAAS